MLIESLGWFLFGAGCATFIWGMVFLTPDIIAKRRDNKKFEDFIQDLKAQGEELLASQVRASHKEVSQLMFRDKTGALCTAEIVIDPDLPELPNMDKEALFKMVQSGEVGTINDMMEGKHKGSMDDVERFIFSSKTVQQMREHGLEIDEFVRNMLKASGRI